ncbi:MAG: hypothetical protein AAFY91_02740, partial [Bacteroidota bacterium]
ESPMNFLPNEGDLEIKLSWTDTDADFDIDLEAPAGVDIDADGVYAGALDGVTTSGDVTSGPGEESIFISNTAPDGNYRLYLNILPSDMAGDLPFGTRAGDLEINSQASSEEFALVLDIVNTDIEVELPFTKTGGTLTFDPAIIRPLNWLSSPNDLSVVLNWNNGDFDLERLILPGGSIVDHEGIIDGMIDGLNVSGDVSSRPGQEFINLLDSAEDGLYTLIIKGNGDETNRSIVEFFSRDTYRNFLFELGQGQEESISFTKFGRELNFF